MPQQLKHESRKVSELIDDYCLGKIVLLEFQRGYVWKPNKAALLMDSPRSQRNFAFRAQSHSMTDLTQTLALSIIMDNIDRIKISHKSSGIDRN